MGCNCGAKKTGVRQARTVTGAAGDSVTRASATGAAGRSRVAFYVVPPPENGDGEELAFTTLYEARAALRQHEGWRLESRRVPIG